MKPTAMTEKEKTPDYSIPPKESLSSNSFDSNALNYYDEDRTLEAKSLVKKFTIYSFGFGLVPWPVLDVLSITGVQLKMLASMSELYNEPFSRQFARKSMASLIGGIGSQAIGRGVVGSLLKFIPGLGQIAGVVSVSMISAATTYAIGQVFIQHFESGGTFLTFDPERVREYYEQKFKEGQQVAADLKADSKN
jgi:uncharacterized protein (DUF697 family)